MDKPTFRSPNEILEAAKAHMLDGREPETVKDWALIVNFAAVNIHHSVGDAALKLFAKIYDMPLTDEYLEECWEFHHKENEDS